MSDQPSIAPDAGTLRQQVEQRLRAQQRPAQPPLDLSDTRTLVHELQVHQIELEMQNEELRRTQAALDATQARYFDLYDLAPVGYVTVSEKGLILEANLTAATLLGVNRTALVQQPLTRFILTEDQNTYYRHRQQLSASGTLQTCELRMVKRDGTPFWARLESASTPDAVGAPVCRVVLSDITERQRIAQRLQASEERHRTLLQTAMDGYWLVDAQGRLLEVSETYCRMSGYSAPELLAMRIPDLEAAEAKEDVAAHIQEVVAQGEARFESRHRRKDGTVFDVEVSVQYRPTEGGRFVGFLRDITQRKRTEQALRESEAQFRHLFEQSPDAVFLEAADGTVLNVNPAACLLQELTREQLLGTNVLELVPADLRDNVAQQFGRWFTGELTFYEGFTRLHDGRSVPVEIRGAMVVHQGQKAVQLHVRDITGRKAAEQALRLSQTRLQLAQQAGRIGTFERNLQTGEIIWSEQLEALYGLPPGGFEGTFADWQQRVLPADRPAVQAELARAVAKRGDFQVEYRVLWPDGTIHWLAAAGKVVADERGESARTLGVTLDITERKEIEETLRFLVQCGVGSAGGGFFPELARYLAQALGMDFVCIDRLEEGSLSAQTLAVLHNGQFEDNVSYTLKDTPCGEVVGRSICCFPQNVRGLFPRDAALQDLRAESYVGSTLWSAAGKPIGLIAVIGRQPLADTRRAQSILQVVAVRAAGELERQQAEAALRRAHDELERRVQERTLDLNQTVAALQAEIVQRQQAEAALRDSEARYRTLFEAAPVGIGISNYRGEVLACNRRLAEMAGVTPEEFCARPAASFYQVPARRRELLAQVRQAGQVAEWEEALQRPDGAALVGRLQMSEIQMGRERVLMTLVQDITQQKEAEQRAECIRGLLELFATKSSLKEYLSAVVKRLRDWCGCRAVGVRLLDASGRIPFAAHVGFTSPFLRSEKELSLQTDDCACVRIVMDRARPEDVPCTSGSGSFFCNHTSQFAAHLPATPTPRSAVACLIAGYESLAHAAIRYRGEIIGTIQLADRSAGRFSAATITFIESVAPLIGEAVHRFQVEAALQESEARFRTLFERHGSVMLLVEPASGALVDANPAAAAFYGYDRETLRRMNLADLDARPRASQAADEHGTWRDEPAPAVFPHRLASGGTCTVEVHASPISIQGQPRSFLIIHDITERKLLEKQVLEISELERRRVGQDLHDTLGSRLTGTALMVKALAQGLARRGQPEAALAEEVVLSINESITETRAIARGLCPVELSVTGLHGGLTELADETRRQSGLACLFRGDQRVQVRDLYVATHLFQIAREAVTNALRHAHARNINIRLTGNAGQIYLEVRDDGTGLPTPVEPTTGLGLRTMRYRARAIGAHLAIRSLRHGTVVSCRLSTG